VHAECPGNGPPLISDTRSVHAECPGNWPPLISDTRSVHAECPGNWPPLIMTLDRCMLSVLVTGLH
jgi:hypothetical protein